MTQKNPTMMNTISKPLHIILVTILKVQIIQHPAQKAMIERALLLFLLTSLNNIKYSLVQKHRSIRTQSQGYGGIIARSIKSCRD